MLERLINLLTHTAGLASPRQAPSSHAPDTDANTHEGVSHFVADVLDQQKKTLEKSDQQLLNELLNLLASNDNSYAALTQIAAGFTNPADTDTALLAFEPGPSPYANLRALLGLSPSYDPAMISAELGSASGARRIARLQELISHLGRYDFKTIDAVSWQTHLSPAEISLVGKLIPHSKRAQWYAGIVFRSSSIANEETHELVRILQIALQDLQDPERIQFAHDLNWAITNRISLARSEGRDTLAPDKPLVTEPAAYLRVDLAHDFILSRAPHPAQQQYDAFTEQNFFLTAAPDTLWDYIWFDDNKAPHPISEVRRRAIEYLELSFLDSSAAGPMAALAGEYTSLALAEEAEISREAKMLWDVVSTLELASPDGDPIYDSLVRFIEAELVGNPHKNFTLNRFVRTAILIDPIATLAHLPAWRELIKKSDPEHYQKFTDVEQQLQAMLFDTLPQHLKRRFPSGLTGIDRLHEWRDRLNDDGAHRDVSCHLIPYFTDKEKRLYGSVSVAALKLVTTLDCDLILPQLTGALDQEIMRVLNKAPSLPVGYPGYGELTAFKDLNYIRFMLASTGRLGNRITSLTLERNRERYRQYTSFPGSHLEAQILQTAAHIEQKRQPGHVIHFNPHEATARRYLSGSHHTRLPLGPAQIRAR